MIRVEYDQATGKADISEETRDAGAFIREGAMIVGLLAWAAAEAYGAEASGALLQMIRNIDDAGGYSLAELREAIRDEAREAEADVDRGGGAGTGGSCVRSEEQPGGRPTGDGGSGREDDEDGERGGEEDFPAGIC